MSFVVAVTDVASFRSSVKSPRIFTNYEYSASNVIIVSCDWQTLSEMILPRSDVIFIDLLRVPKEETPVSNLDLSANKVTTIHSMYPLFDGSSLSVSVKENRPDTNDIDLRGRYVNTPFTSSTFTNHATLMSSIIAGAGNSYYEGKGAAPGAGINSVSFTNLLPEPDVFYQQYNVSVQNHSYGTGIENLYAPDAMAYDASVITRPTLTHVFSAGNSGTSSAPTGLYTGINNYANLTGSFKMAKNILTVGHTDSFGMVLPLSSRGPAYDGRIKPELVAFAEDGSSGAAAIVSGISLNLQHAYKSLVGNLPSSALVRAALINSADDTGAPGPDFIAGFGTANGIKAVETITRGNYLSGSVGNGALNAIALTVPPNLKLLKVTLTWNDPPAAANALRALVNDLDLELEEAATSIRYLPWVLSHFPHIDSLTKLAVRKRDSLNNVEQITIPNPAPGNYIIRVRGFNVPSSSPQSYFIAYQFDTLNNFRWYYPTATDNIFGGVANTIRWESNYPGATGRLEYTLDNGASWSLINNAVDLDRGYFKWNAPDTFVTSRLRMSISSSVYPTQLFTISNRMQTFVGFNCPDSFQFYWRKLAGVNSYRVYRLGNKYMEPLMVTNDTLVVLGKNSNSSLYYAVAPVLGSLTGVRSFAFNYTTQGVDCYIKSFFVTLQSNTVLLSLELGTIYNVRSITWQEKTSNGFVALQTINSPVGLTFSQIDNFLHTGANIYRVRIDLLDGRVVYSQEESVFFAGNGHYIVYPNPASQNQTIRLFNEDAAPTRFVIFNSTGAKVSEGGFSELFYSLPIVKLSKGLYVIRLLRDNEQPETLKLIIQ